MKYHDTVLVLFVLALGVAVFSVDPAHRSGAWGAAFLFLFMLGAPSGRGRGA